MTRSTRRSNRQTSGPVTTRLRGPVALVCIFILAGAGSACRREDRNTALSIRKVAAAELGADPRSVARAFNSAAKAGDFRRALALSSAATEFERQAVRVTVRTAAAAQRLSRSVAERFGPEAEYEVPPSHPYDEEFEEAAVRIDGDRAMVLTGAWKDAKNAADLNHPKPGVYRLVRSDRGWRVDVGGLQEKIPVAGAGDAVVRRYERAAEKTANEVRAGKFRSPSDAVSAFNERLLWEVGTPRE